MCGSKTQTTTQKSSPAPEAMKYYKELMGRLGDVGELQYDPYTGERVAGFTPYQEQAMQSIANLQGTGAETMQQAVEAAQRGAAPLTSGDIQRYQDPYQQMVIDAMSAQMRQQEAEDISKLQGQSISAGAFGGDRAKLAQAQLMRNQEQERNMRISDLMSKGYSSALAAAQADRQMAQSGAGMLGSIAAQQITQPLSYINALYGAGRSQQELEQQRLNVPYETYLEQRAFPYQQLQYLAGIGTGVGSQMGGKSTTSQPGPNMFSQILGAGLSLGMAPVTGGGSLMGNFFSGSDERLKENIEDVGTTNDGQTIYKYNYKGDPKTHIGLLAQEVEQTHPEAVRQNTAGFKFVNYDLATKDSVHKAEGGGLKQTALFQKGFIPGIDPVKGQGAPGAPPPAQQQQSSLEDMVDTAIGIADKIKKSKDPTNPASWQTTTTLSPENPASWNTTVSQPSFLSNLASYLPFAHGGGINVPHYDNGGGTKPTDRIIGISSAAKKFLKEKTPEETAASADLPQIEITQPDKSDKPPAQGFSEPYGESGAKEGPGLFGDSFSLSPEAKQALMVAGLGMMAGQSPFALSNIGAGGLAGVKAYGELMKSKQEKALKEKEIAAKGSKLNLMKSGMVTDKGEAVFIDKNTGQSVDINNEPITPDTPLITQKEYEMKRKGELKTESDLPKVQSKLSTQIYENQRAKDDIKKAREKIGYLTTGFLGVPLSKIPGTEAADLAEDIRSIQARLGFEQLQTMRQNSPTGGALGNVSNQEIAYLQAAVQSLSTNQSPDQLRQKFDEIATHLDRIEEIQKQAFAQQYGEDKLFETLPKTGETTTQPSTTQNYKEGQKIQYGDGSVGIVKNGQIVPYQGQ